MYYWINSQQLKLNDNMRIVNLSRKVVFTRIGLFGDYFNSCCFFLMKNKFVFFVFCSLVFVWVVLGTESQVSITLSARWLFVWTPANLNLWSVSPGGTVEVNFDDYFWVEDLRWTSTGHYTTIQCDGLYWSNNYIITGVQLSWINVEMIAGISNSTLIYSNLNSRTDITQPQLYLYRNNSSSNNWVINRYGNKPSIRVFVPEYAPVGTYKWKITYTLYDMAFNY
jgi:hypothetical protein